MSEVGTPAAEEEEAGFSGSSGTSAGGRNGHMDAHQSSSAYMYSKTMWHHELKAAVVSGMSGRNNNN
jgi:hypothetical protein